MVAGRWLNDHSFSRPTWTIAELEAAKGSRTISVVLPALNEEQTVGSVVETITPLLGGLVDEIIVLDSGSTDDTEIRALAAGARVISREVALPEVTPQPGKGEVLWRSLAVTTGDIVVFVDSDLIDPDPMFVPKLLGPLLTVDGVHLVKGFYRRPLKISGSEDATGGGRVTELVARPLLASLRPELMYVMQPLGGEYAGTRELLTSVPFAPGLRRGDRPAHRHLRPARPGRYRAGQPRRPGTSQPAADRARLDEQAGHRHPVVALWHPRLRGRADAVLRRRERLHAALFGGVAGRPAADDLAATALAAGGGASSSDR